MKKRIVFCVFLVNHLADLAQVSSELQVIRDNFQKWQPILQKERANSASFFQYVWGMHYEKEQWYTEEQVASDTFLYQKAQLLEEPALGTLVTYEKYAISGDWHIVEDHYFDKNGSLYFVFWRMNTYYAAVPITVQKRAYFNADGTLIRELQSVYKMNTKEEITTEFLDQDIEYKLQLDEVAFYDVWKNKL